MTARHRLVSGAGLGATIVLCCAAGLLLPVVASAQNTATGLEEVTVTARKRDEKLLDIPLTISVLTAKAIDEKGIRELSQVVDFTPGFFYGGPSVGSNSRNNRRLLIRGMQFNTDVQTKQGATLFIDGAPVLGAEIGRLSAVERIEIVKGPQSAYFGRSTFSGAINVITRNPGSEWQRTVRAEAASYGTTDLGFSIEGPILGERLTFRFDASDYRTKGQYDNAGGLQEGLGERETRDAQATFFAKPNDSFSAKLRLHAWEDEDGPPAGFTYAAGNAQDAFNCRLSGTGGSPSVNGTNNWICGEPRFPTLAEISLDTVITPDVLSRLTNAEPTGRYLLGSGFLDHYGLARRAYEMSLVMNYEFSNGWTLSSITAEHQNKHRTLDDLDRRATESRGLNRNWVQLSDNVRKDFSQELRLTSGAEQRLKWMVGLNYSDIEALVAGNSRLLGPWSIGSGITTNAVETSGVFASLGFDLSDHFTASLEGRYQKDKVTDGFEIGVTLSDTFTSTTPRLILDYKPNANQTWYASYAKGTRPGSFNPNVVTLPPTVLACLLASAAGDIAVPEEELDNIELGFKGRLLDGRMQLTTAVYRAEWRKMNNRGGPLCLFPNGTTQTVFVTGTGGSADLQGIEIEMTLAATEKLTIEAAFALNDSKILARACADCTGILGVTEIAGLDKEFSRTPRTSGSLSASYRSQTADGRRWFTRGDYIYKGSMYATEANIAETGASHRFNVRAGYDLDALTLELYVTNLFNDKTFTGFQRFTDGSVSSTAVMLTAGLPDKRTVGARATYRFDP
jgi:iron complex outermembrane receptor protein